MCFHFCQFPVVVLFFSLTVKCIIMKTLCKWLIINESVHFMSLLWVFKNNEIMGFLFAGFQFNLNSGIASRNVCISNPFWYHFLKHGIGAMVEETRFETNATPYVWKPTTRIFVGPRKILKPQGCLQWVCRLHYSTRKLLYLLFLLQ